MRLPPDTGREKAPKQEKWAKIAKNFKKIWSVQKNSLTLQRKSPGGGMVDALVSGASAARRAGSSPVLGTHQSRNSLKIKSCGIFLLIFVLLLSSNSKITFFLSSETPKFYPISALQPHRILRFARVTIQRKKRRGRFARPISRGQVWHLMAIVRFSMPCRQWNGERGRHRRRSRNGNIPRFSA